MAENIDNLLVGLGLDVDQQSFQKGRSSLLGLRGAALTAGAAISTAVGGAAATAALAKVRSQAGYTAEALGLSADEADRLGFALEQAGGNSDNAIESLKQIRDIRDQFRYGTGPLADVGMFGIDASEIARAGSEMEALLNISEQLQGLDPTQRNRAMESLGLSGTGIQNLLRGGPGEFRSQLDRAAELRTLTDEEIETSQELTRATNELSRAFTELTDSVVLKLAPALTDTVEFLADVIPDVEFGIQGDEDSQAGRAGEATGNAIKSFWDSVVEGYRGTGGGSTETAPPTGFTGDLLRGQPDRGAATWIPDIWPETLDAVRQVMSGQPSAPAGTSGGLSPEELNYEASPSELIPEGGGLEFQRGNRRLMREYFPEQYQGSTTTATFNIYDARDPDAVARTVRREIADLSNRAADDYRGRVS